MKPKAIAIIRVSRLNKQAQSPEVQRRLIMSFAERQGWVLADMLNENEIRGGNVSGGLDVSKRPGFGPAIESVASGQARIIVAADLSRLFRDIDQQRQTITRIENAGGQFWTVANGRITHKTADAELNANIQGSMNHFQRRYARDKSWLAVEVAIEQGKIPWSQTPPGYLRSDDSKLTPDNMLAGVIADAFMIRDEGGTIAEVREHLADHGIERSYHGVQHLLRDRVYIGQIHFGAHTPNWNTHDAIVDEATFRRVQKRKDERGPKPKSDRLLARLGVLRCGTCGSRMVVATSKHSQYYIYRCPPVGDCPRRVTISAEMVERAVVDAVGSEIHGVYGKWSRVAANRRKAQLDLDHAQAELDAAIRVLADFVTEQSARDKLDELRDIRDGAQKRLDGIHGPGRVRLKLTNDWDSMSLDEKRDQVRSLIERVDVHPGRGPDRIHITLFDLD